MNNANPESRGIDPECYARGLEPILKRRSEREQIFFAYNCASSVAHFYRKFDPTDLCTERAVRTVKLWLDGQCSIDAVKELVPKVSHAFERAMAAYNETDSCNNIHNASPAGIVAYQVTEAARSVEDLLHAVIYSKETACDDPIDPTGYCADAAAGALAARIYCEAEIKRQSDLIYALE
ncbi:hypothetical protein [Candidatus Laterigemmans baculatus]|uniref:hypothetical protein n=1 Tax=Candidatus Laterigemmans baculatus TaxID=2770505 RepID=UPI0013DA3AB4|nr:hypothetical protein [Candidatus Laterigemmans baculatus]